MDRILSIKKLIEKTAPEFKLIISNITQRTDNGKASLTAIKLNEKLSDPEFDYIDNNNIKSEGSKKAWRHLKS